MYDEISSILESTGKDKNITFTVFTGKCTVLALSFYAYSNFQGKGTITVVAMI
jgi:hypothetical protein